MQAVVNQTVRHMDMLPVLSQAVYLEGTTDVLPAQITNSPTCPLGSAWVGCLGLIPVLQKAQHLCRTKNSPAALDTSLYDLSSRHNAIEELWGRRSQKGAQASQSYTDIQMNLHSVLHFT